jgi:hypothetical protein
MADVLIATLDDRYGGYSSHLQSIFAQALRYGWIGWNGLDEVMFADDTPR